MNNSLDGNSSSLSLLISYSINFNKPLKIQASFHDSSDTELPKYCAAIPLATSFLIENAFTVGDVPGLKRIKSSLWMKFHYRNPTKLLKAFTQLVVVETVEAADGSFVVRKHY